MRAIVVLLVLSIGLNGLLAGYLAGHMSHGHEHGCDCDCTPCDCQHDDGESEETKPSIDELKRMRGWVPS